MNSSALAEKLAYTEQPQYGHITNEPEAIDSTGRPIRAKNLREKLNEGQTIYNRLSDRTAPIPKDMPVNNIINQNAGNFNGLNNIVEQIKQFFRK